MERGLQTRNVLMGERSPDGASLKFEDENLNTNYLISLINKALPGSTELDSESYLKSLTKFSRKLLFGNKNHNLSD